MGKVEDLEEKLKQDTAKLLLAKAAQKSKERKQRTRQLIQLGGLCEIAGLTNVNPAILLGGLLHLARKIQSSPDLVGAFQKEGEEVLLVRSEKK